MYRIERDDGGSGGVVVVSPSDLLSFLDCPHKTALDLEVAAGRRDRPVGGDAEAEVLQRRGLEHEARYRQWLHEQGLEVVDCDRSDAPRRQASDGDRSHGPGDPAGGHVGSPSDATGSVGEAPDPQAGAANAAADQAPDGTTERPPTSLAALRARAEATREAIEAGVDVVFQATFLDDRDEKVWWRGHADFLCRAHDAHPTTGRPAYEPEDTKLARHVKPSAVLQLATYAGLLEQVQGVAPRDVHVVLGGQTTETLSLRHAAAYERLARRRFTEVVAAGDVGATAPDPIEHCGVCRWHDTCDEERRAGDHLSLVANLGREQARKLTAAGIATVAELAALADQPREAWPAVPRLGDAVYERLVEQARLQVAARSSDGPPPWEVLPPSRPDDGDATADLGSDRGLEALPEPSGGDLYFDIEGDPFVDDGLEYLFGIGWWEDDSTAEDGRRFAFRAFWGHSATEEKRAFEDLMDFIAERRAEDPNLHVYHYAPYETTALCRLMGRHGTREDELDDLLRHKMFVDLFRVVRQGLRVGVESYSIKKLEPLYMGERADAIVDAGSSIVEYERWLETGDQQILDDIEAYNRTDCESTALLHAWLEDRRTEAEERLGAPLHRQVPPRDATVDADEASVARTAEVEAVLEELAALGDRLLDGVDLDRLDEDADGNARWLLSQLLHFHRREDKPAWWRYFARITGYEPGSLDDDAECLNGLEYEGVVDTVKRSEIHRYRFDPEQEHRISAGTPVYDPAVERERMVTGEKLPRPGTVVAVDPVAGTIDLKRGNTSSAPHPRDLMPDEIVPSGSLKIAVQVVAEAVVERGIDGDGPFRAVRDLLARRAPRVRGVTPGEPLRRDGEDTKTALSRLMADLDDSYLPVQGPPGTGKTFTAAHAIVDLVDAGRRVGITANSHAVVTHLLDKAMSFAAERGVVVRAMQSTNGDAICSERDDVTTTSTAKVCAAVEAGEVDLVAGTAWLFANDALEGAIDVLVVDEAGQLSLANVVAAGRAARNLVLVGDPQQLAQPVTGSHPPGVGISGLEHVLHGEATVPDDRGLFLDRTWRMHPEITRFVSELAYDERLESEPHCAGQRIHGEGALAGSGVRWLPVEHDGNRLSSEEEAEHVAALVDELVGQCWTDEEGCRQEITLDDVLVVAPYNAQVHLLARHLPEGARVGTVDRFQGQEGAVVIVSMTASSVEQVPRGMEFLYSANRLNVAVSRARALTVVVASPTLLTSPVGSVEQLRLVNGLCRYAELAEPIGFERSASGRNGTS